MLTRLSNLIRQYLVCFELLKGVMVHVSQTWGCSYGGVFYICEGFRKGFREMSQENAILTHAQRFGKLVEDSLSLHANSLSSVLS